jgi:large subunit ribosomal protein L13
MAKTKQKIDRQYHLFDAQGKVLGRLATQIARLLIGKHKVDYAPHIDGGDFVVVTNTDGIVATGNKSKQKIYHRFSGYPSGVSSITLGDQMKKDSRKVIWQAIYNMLPKNSLRDRMLKRLLIYKNGEYEEKTIHITHK